MASNTSRMAPWTILSSSAGTPICLVVPFSLGDVDPPDGLMPVTHRLHPLVQILELLLQALPVLLVSDSIHPHRRVLADSTVGPLQRGHIQQIRQRVEPGFGFSFRSFRYLQQFR
jgi:hypothetical protein